jgi:mono/diheme cytochrome c family protein
MRSGGFLRSVSRAAPALPASVLAFLLTALALALAGCGKGDSAAARSPAEKGRTLYSLHCTACHNPDPARDGALGPSVMGSDLDLLRARIIQGDYPAGYTPKRPTRIMQKLPLSEEDVKALHAYLNGL